MDNLKPAKIRHIGVDTKSYSVELKIGGVTWGHKVAEARLKAQTQCVKIGVKKRAQQWDTLSSHHRVYNGVENNVFKFNALYWC